MAWAGVGWLLIWLPVGVVVGAAVVGVTVAGATAVAAGPRAADALPWGAERPASATSSTIRTAAFTAAAAAAWGSLDQDWGGLGSGLRVDAGVGASRSVGARGEGRAGWPAKG